jgi:hypothetical protein
MYKTLTVGCKRKSERWRVVRAVHVKVVGRWHGCT